MTSTGTQNSRKMGKWIVVAVLVVAALVAVLAGREGSPFNLAPRFQPNTEITGVIGSEKRAFFEDPEVIDVLDKNGVEVKIDTAGSRRIATETDLEQYDFAFPSSAPAADKIARDNENLGVSTPFHSPMAIATFSDVIESLEKEGAATRDGERWTIDMEQYVQLNTSNARWRDLGGSYHSPRTVQISTTDLRTSNSAAMYLAILSWVMGRGTIATEGSVSQLVDRIAPLFTGQGYSESTSAAPFGDYLSQGMGGKPLVMVYEAQYLEEAMSENSRLASNAVLAYPSPTVTSKHSIVAFNSEGEKLAKLLAEDPELQRLAAKHGFRPRDQRVFDEVLNEAGVTPPPPLVDVVDPPNYDVLESLIEGVVDRY